MARPSLTRAHRALLGVVAVGACVISGIGFAGSYNSVRDLALEKGFGTFAYAFPIGVDAGIVVLLSLDLVLTWLRIPFPLLRQTAWLLTAATIAFNAAASWGDALGMAMHAVIPVLFVVVVEASRHAVGRIAAITADRHMESVRLMRWVLSPVPTFRLWRRMKLWELRSYDETVRLEQNRLVYRAQLRFRYGRGWRRSAPFQALLPLKLAKYGVPLDPSVLDRIDGPLVVSGGGALPGAEEQAAPAVRVGQPAQVQSAQQVQQVQAAQVQAAALGAAERRAQPAQHQQQAQQQGQAVPQVSAAVAVPTLAKLAAVRLRDQQDPEAAQAAPPIDPSAELNVWTTRPVRSHVAAEQVHTARVPGQASPWFKAPRPEEAPRPQSGYQPPQGEGYEGYEAYEDYPGGYEGQPEQQGRPAEYRPAANGRGPVGQQQPSQSQQVRAEAGAEPILVSGRPVRLDAMTVPGPESESEPEPLSFEEPEQAPARRPFGGAPEPLDGEECFDALVAYMDTYDDHPDKEQFAEYLTQRGLAGSRSDGGVTVKDVDKVWGVLQRRYVTSGRGE
ncbi:MULTISPECIES: DUF2637 domain-containing protein [Kitasatospora]|uniref:DUF2637 domain-containing protein n=1 Tax=Kitasatospora setae (strain ATCC 33774 / DSM 43861 / JCM 3304 / KCC A-0304 / NBRC 14216 / KM-6054) TaxID=452652 RepID=E4NHS6_KITSK|nr:MULTISPECIES: DUF2637 domain-containing protein [Kitasatospora]BAJ31056.1 hypothetical protein KSE_52800 [Kitasatospora setae KM-6054]